MRPIPALSWLGVLLLLGPPLLFATETTLNIEVWVPAEPARINDVGAGLDAGADAIFNGAINPQSAERETAALRAEARSVLGAMIYGYDFVYVPGDVQRAVAEEFRLQPRGTIGADDRRLTIRSLRREDGRLYGRIAYRPSADQCRRLAAWQSADLVHIGGDSGVSLADATRQQAQQEAVRMALRHHLRDRIASKPRRVVGTLLLAATPRDARDPTGWRAAVSLKIHLVRVDPYLIY